MHWLIIAFKIGHLRRKFLVFLFSPNYLCDSLYRKMSWPIPRANPGFPDLLKGSGISICTCPNDIYMFYLVRCWTFPVHIISCVILYPQCEGQHWFFWLFKCQIYLFLSLSLESFVTNLKVWRHLPVRLYWREGIQISLLPEFLDTYPNSLMYFLWCSQGYFCQILMVS